MSKLAKELNVGVDVLHPSMDIIDNSDDVEPIKANI
jgi:hypothetical protein